MIFIFKVFYHFVFLTVLINLIFHIAYSIIFPSSLLLIPCSIYFVSHIIFYMCNLVYSCISPVHLTSFREKTIFSPLYVLTLLSILIKHGDIDLFLSSILFHRFVCLFICKHQTLLTTVTFQYFDIRYCDPSQFFLLSQNAETTQGLFRLHVFCGIFVLGMWNMPLIFH